MSREALRATPEGIRRLVVTKQRLAGPRSRGSGAGGPLAVVRDLAYVQWDPIAVVAPSHLLSFWARLDGFRPTTLERLLWKDRSLFEHWMPIASLVRTADFPIYRSLMRRYPGSLSNSWGSQRTAAREFLARHRSLRTRILAELEDGPRRIDQFTDHARTKRHDGAWNPSSDVTTMLYHLSMTGDVMVVGRDGVQNLWGLADAFLPSSVDRSDLSEEEVDRAAAQRAIGALGAASPAEMNYYYVRGRYRDPSATVAALEDDGVLQRVEVEGAPLREVRYVLATDVPLLERIERRTWVPRLSLLPPFDTMVSSSARLDRLFGFHYVREQFLPVAKRRYGFYVLPIVWGTTFIGRIDPRFDRETGTLEILAVHAEPEAPMERDVGARIRDEIDRLADFVGASRVSYPARLPPGWAPALG